MKQTTTKGRIWAGLMALLMVIGLLPATGRMVFAATYTNEQARQKINQILSGSDYTPQMSRVHGWSKTSRSGYTQQSDGSYYSTNDSNGVCTWNAVTSLLNRKQALEKGSNFGRFTMSTVAPVLSNTPAENYFEYKVGSKYYMYVGKKPSSGYEYVGSYTDHYESTFTSAENDKITLEKITFSSSKVSDRKEELKTLLDQHPEGIVVQFSKSSGNYNHGIVISSYYMDGTNIRFRVVDSVDVRDSNSGEINMETAWIGRGYNNNNSAETIIQNLQWALGVSNYVAGNGEPAAVKIDNLSIDGKTSSISLALGQSANLMGSVISGTIIKSINAIIKNAAGSIVYNETICPNTTNVNLKESALNKSVGGQQKYIKFGSLGEGSYTLTVTAKDAMNKTATKSLAFAVASGIQIDLSAFKGTLTYGQSYGIPGTITSAANISKVYARVVNGQDQYQSTATYRKGHSKAGQRVECTVTGVNAKNFNIRGSKIDNALSMGGLNVGNYYFEVTVTDVNGKTKTVRRAFSVR